VVSENLPVQLAWSRPSWVRPLAIVLAVAVCAAGALAVPWLASSPGSGPSSAKLTATLRGTGAGACPCRRSGITSAVFSPSDTTLATAESNGHIDLWNGPGGRLAATFTDPDSNGGAAVAFSPSGTTLAAADGNGKTYLWDVTTGKLTVTLTDPGASPFVDSAAFSPSGTTLATADQNGHVYLWNVATRKLMVTLTDPESSGVAWLAFSPSGTTLATGDVNGNTYLWKLS
jgi:WD40 repeat protein